MKSYAVIGLGRFGSALSRQLCKLGAEVLALDVRADFVQQISGDVTHAVVGDAQDKEVLKALGVRNLDCAVIAIGDNLAASVLIAMNLKELGVPYVVCKAHDETHRKVLEKLGLRRYPTEPEQTMYSKWLVDWQFTPDAILRAVDETIKSSNPSFAYLDGILKRLHEQGNVRTEQDVSGDIEGSRKENEPIKQFLRALGNYSITINDTTKATYKSFQTMYPDPVILLAAQQCAKWGMTTLQDVMQTLMAWQNRSLRTLPEIDAYMRQIDEQNEFLIVLYQAMQLDEKTKPNAADRALVKQWTEEWRFAQMFVLGCAPWAAGKKSPMAYLNKMLKVFREKGITTMEAAKAERERFEQQPSQSTAPAAHAQKVVGEQQYTQRTYTPTQDAMDAMMQEWEESHA